MGTSDDAASGRIAPARRARSMTSLALGESRSRTRSTRSAPCWLPVKS